MFDLENNTMSLGDVVQKDLAWEVGFQTPVGLTMSMEKAVKVCKDNDWDPNLMIRPVVIVSTNDLYEVVCR